MWELSGLNEVHVARTPFPFVSKQIRLKNGYRHSAYKYVGNSESIYFLQLLVFL